MKTEGRDIRELLERYYDLYDRPEFIESDPVSIPRSFTGPDDIEIAGFFAATLAWGNRKAIIKSAQKMMDLMDRSPAEFVRSASEGELRRLGGFVYRTFNGSDLTGMCLCLRSLIEESGSLRAFFEREYAKSCELKTALSAFRLRLLATEHEAHLEKHVSNIDRGAACKRLFMFLRWMVRRDERGVDFGLWTGIPPSALYIPLDVHSSATARALGLLGRKQNDFRAAEELTLSLRAFDPRDPVRFDFALFGAGVNGAAL